MKKIFIYICLICVILVGTIVIITALQNDGIAYAYSPQTGEYFGEVKMQKNPLEGGYLLPASATTLKPPQTSENQVAVFENNKWAIKDDYRGAYWHKISKEEIYIDNIGEPLSNDFTEVKPTSSESFVIWDGNEWIIDETLKNVYNLESNSSIAISYLQSTDWYAIRKMETGVDIPSGIQQEREQVRQIIDSSFQELCSLGETRYC